MGQRFEELIAGAEHDSAGAYHRALRGGKSDLLIEAQKIGDFHVTNDFYSTFQAVP